MILAILVNVEWYHAVVFICISLMANYFEHLILYLLTFCVIFLEKNVSSDPLPIFNGLSASLILKCKSSYIYSGDKSFIIYDLHIFSFCIDFHFLNSAFWSLNAVLIQSNSIMFLVSCLRILKSQVTRIFLPMFSSKSFIFLSFTFRSVTYFFFFFGEAVKYRWSFIF